MQKRRILFWTKANLLALYKTQFIFCTEKNVPILLRSQPNFRETEYFLHRYRRDTKWSRYKRHIAETHFYSKWSVMAKAGDKTWIKCNQSKSFQKCDSCPARTSTQGISPIYPDRISVFFSNQKFHFWPTFSGVHWEQWTDGSFMTKVWARMHCSQSSA